VLLYEKKEEDNFMKKKLAMLLTAAMLVGSLAACGSSDNGSSATGSASATDSTKTDAAATEVSTEGKQLTVQIGPDPETIDPALNSAVDGGNMLLHSFECLLTVQLTRMVRSLPDRLRPGKYLKMVLPGPSIFVMD
jgi:ABC-type transport system substrate-binding protein